MRNLIFSFASFTAIIASLFFLFSAHPNKAETNIAQNVASKESSRVFPIPALNEHKQQPEGLELLTQGEWQMQSITSNKPCDTNYDGHFTTDAMSEMPACALDDVIKFYNDGIVAFQRNERCELTEEDVEKYNWFYTAKDRKLSIARGSVEAVMVLRSLSEKQLVVDIPMQDGGESHVFTVIYRHLKSGQPSIAMR